MRRSLPIFAVSAFALTACPLVEGQLFNSLQAFGARSEVGDPTVDGPYREGPKGVATSDFDGDGDADLAVSNLDGTITLLRGQGNGSFLAPIHLQTGVKTLRGIIASDLNGDGRAEIIAAAPADEKVVIQRNDGSGNFTNQSIGSWFGCRDVAEGDFDGDGDKDLAAAGPSGGVHWWKNDGSGLMTKVGYVEKFPTVGYANDYSFKPVHPLKSIRSLDGTRDDLLAGAEWLTGLYSLSIQEPTPPVGGWTVAPSRQALPTENFDSSSPFLITEFVASNKDGITDEDGKHSDWIEIYNRSTSPQSLAGWALTEDRDGLVKWVFPAVTVPAGGFQLVFASENNRKTVGQPLHTDFKLSASGEYLALLKPDGTVAHSYPGYYYYWDGQYYFNAQYVDISFGLTLSGSVDYFSLPSPGAEANANGLYSGDMAYYQPGIYNSGVSQVFDVTPLKVEAGQDVVVTIQPRIDYPVDSIRIYAYEAGSWTYYWGWDSPESVMEKLPDGSYTKTLRIKNSNNKGLYLYAYGWISGNCYNWVYDQTTGWTYQTYLCPYANSYYMGSAAIQVVQPAVLGDNLKAIASCQLSNSGQWDDTGSPAIAVGSLLQPASASTQDLVTLGRWNESISIRRGVASPKRFDDAVAQTVRIPGGPREVAIADLDGDGWNDLIVVLRNFDRVVTLKNRNGTFELSSEIPTGSSPRDIAVADFDGNGSPDAAVINRISEDVSVLTTFPGSAGFGKLDQIYPADGDVGALWLRDVNADGRADVMMLHRSSGELTVRKTLPGGKLGEPVPYKIGDKPATLAVVDVNIDGIPDIVTPNMTGAADANQGWWAGTAVGSISVRLGLAAGGYGPETIYTMPTNAQGSLFAVQPGDFDNDGDIDLAAGYYDCRVAFFRNNGSGVFEFTHAHMFIGEARVMTTGDFDQDGDIDLAGAGYAGDVVIVENEGNLLTTTQIRRTEYRPVRHGKMGSYQIFATHLNEDNDLDLVVGSGNGCLSLFGSDGMTFISDDVFPADGNAVDGLAIADFDGDGVKDFASACRILSCVTILKKNALNKYVPAITVDVPGGRLLAAGDIDGDGHADLAGVGDVLWVALSSKVPTLEAYQPKAELKVSTPALKLNEVLAWNNDIQVEGNGKADFIELYNGTTQSISLSGWRIELASGDPAAPTTLSKTLSAESVPAGGLIVIICELGSDALRTGWKIPRQGGRLRLIAPNGSVADSVNFGEQRENVSYARYRDGDPTWVFNGIPSPERSNLDNGPLDPVATLDPINPDALVPGQAIQLTARANDEFGVVGLYMNYRRLDLPNAVSDWILFYDDGLHNDGGRLDGVFTGMLPGLPAGAEIEYTLTVQDLSGRWQTTPEDGRLGQSLSLQMAHSLALVTGSSLRFSEIVADNKFSGLVDEGGGTPDYIEIENTSGTEAYLTGVSISKSLTASKEEMFTFAEGTKIEPGGKLVVYCDNNLDQGALHAPFKISLEGETLLLLGTTSRGARSILDSVSTGQLKSDEAWIRLPGDGTGANSAWAVGKPSPKANNLLEDWGGFTFTAGGSALLSRVYRTETGKTYIPERSINLQPNSWSRIGTSISGDGYPRTISTPANGNRGYLRVRSTP